VRQDWNMAAADDQEDSLLRTPGDPLDVGEDSQIAAILSGDPVDTRVLVACPHLDPSHHVRPMAAKYVLVAIPLDERLPD